MNENLRLQCLVVVASIVLFGTKIYAWYLTGSVAIFTDAMESTVNVITGLIGLYSLYLSSLPKDKNHPYGHGKVEFLSASVEGTLITLAGIFIIHKAIMQYNKPITIQKLDVGIAIILGTAVVNFIIGRMAVDTGNKNNSLALVASGQHLKSDSYSSLGILIGLIALRITGIGWIDGTVAIVFALIIIREGIKILRASVAGIMDEADLKIINRLVKVLNENKHQHWIDLHNLRIIKYGATLHMDCHLTIPWYFNIHEGHAEVDRLEKLVKSNFNESIELFVHTDGCLDFSCKICVISDCAVRKNAFVERLEWNLENISLNSKHRL